MKNISEDSNLLVQQLINFLILKLNVIVNIKTRKLIYRIMDSDIAESVVDYTEDHLSKYYNL